MTERMHGGAQWVVTSLNAATGVIRWVNSSPVGVAARDLAVDGTRVYVTGQGNVGTESFLTVVAYARANGAQQWRTDSRPATNSSGTAGLRIALAPDGSLVATGQAGLYLDWYTIAVEPNGSVRWTARRDERPALDEIPAAAFVLPSGTAVVTGPGGPALPGGFVQGVTVGYGPDGTVLWEAFARLATVWAVPLPNGDVCAAGGYDALVTCWRIGGSANQPPVAAIVPASTSGTAPLTVHFDGRGSTDPDGAVTSWAWDFGDGSTGSGSQVDHVYTTPGTFTATLTVTDGGGATDDATASITVTAASTFDLTVTRAGTGSGRVRSADGRINCGNDCSETYATGTVVRLSARADRGSVFAGWSGACSGTATTCVVTLSSAKAVTATFTRT